MSLDAATLAALQATFLDESFEGLDRAEAGLLGLDAKASAEVIGDLFRAIHSIKGGAGAFGVDEIASLAHVMENLMDDVRSGRAVATQDIRGALLAGVDDLRRALVERRAGRRVGEDAHISTVARLVAAQMAAPKDTPRAPAAAAAATPAAVASDAPWRVRFAPGATLAQRGNDPLRMIRELVELGGKVVAVDTHALPALGELGDPTLLHLAWTIEVAGRVARSEIEDVFAWVEGECELAIERITPPKATTVAATPVSPADKTADPIGSVRVGVDKIDLLMNMVGELVITQSMLGELDDDRPLDAERIAMLREGLSQLARNTRALQESVVRLRSMPVGVVFGRLPRLVHDLGAKLGKEVELELSGQTTELDKTMLEKLGDPLVHIVRNSIDHGLETPEARVAAGKPRVGKVRLHAEHAGSAIVIEISDDGRGLDHERILATARARGMIAADAQLSDEEIAQLIFAPGFSTAFVVSDVSGRGVGMDVVWRHIKEVGGDVRVESSRGKGTRTTLRLPLTLAIIDGQLIRLADQQYVIPLLSIVETVLIDAAQVKRLGRADVVRIREQIVPLVDLGALFGLRAPGTATSRLVMIVETDDGPLGLVVDELMAQQQVVIKSLETNFGRVDGLAGATILGDGKVAFIADIDALARMVRRVPSSLAA